MLAALVLAATLRASLAYVTLVQDPPGVWWFADGGKKFLSFSVNHVNNGGLDDGVGGREAAVCRAATNNSLCGDSLNFAGALGYAPLFQVTQDKFGSEAAWAASTVAQLRGYSFNGISGWSHTLAEREAAAQGLYYFHLLDIGTTWPHSHEGLDLDVWDPAFAAQCAAIAAAQVPQLANDPHLIAWQTDNEPNFAAVGLFKYLRLYAQGPGGAHALAWLQARYASLAALNAAWGTAAASWAALGAALPARNAAAFAADDADFVAVVVGRYMNISTAAIRKFDSNHLISGVRFSYNSPQIAAAAAKHCDFLDQHDYGDLPDLAGLAAMHRATGKPIVLGEFSFTAADSNMPNTHGARAGRPERTQTGRTAKYRAYAEAVVRAPFMLGCVARGVFVSLPSLGFSLSPSPSLDAPPPPPLPPLPLLVDMAGGIRLTNLPRGAGQTGRIAITESLASRGTPTAFSWPQ